MLEKKLTISLYFFNIRNIQSESSEFRLSNNIKIVKKSNRYLTAREVVANGTDIGNPGHDLSERLYLTNHESYYNLEDTHRKKKKEKHPLTFVFLMM